MPYTKGPHNIVAVNMMAQLFNGLEDADKNYVIFPSDQKIYFPRIGFIEIWR